MEVESPGSKESGTLQGVKGDNVAMNLSPTEMRVLQEYICHYVDTNNIQCRVLSLSQ